MFKQSNINSYSNNLSHSSMDTSATATAQRANLTHPRPTETSQHRRGRGAARRGRGRGGGIQANGPRGEESTSHLRRSRGHLHQGRGQAGRTATSEQAHHIVLSPNAAEFVPGQAKSAIHTHRPRRASILKSTALDIATRTHEDIENGIYECPICTNEVQRNSKVWSCKTCWTVFHLKCVEKWSKNEGSATVNRQLENGEDPPAKQWRCPGCNLPKEDFPSSYFCWCGKETDPASVPGLPPHSCGQSCGKQRLPKRCPHPCELLCHAGPCPPCKYMGPTQSCFCGKNISTKRCIDTEYDHGWSCDQVCGDLLPCGDHTCTRPCHEGLCGACEIPIDARCYCGKTSKQILCIEKSDEKQSQNQDEQWIGIFDCHLECGREFDCGEHRCERSCHTQDTEPAHCPRSPDIVKHCPCGKTALSEISLEPRSACTDSIPNCTKSCQKRLRCGHACEQVCHSGECSPCFQRVQVTCRCGRTTMTSMCHQGYEDTSQCTRICKATLNCGRHECGEHCCAGEKKASERQAIKRKLRPLGTSHIMDYNFEAEHICTRICGRILKCGTHECPELCHKGPCKSCREAIFEEISCHCGRTVLQPPLPCGTKPPLCRFDCERARPCGHPQIGHNCHGDDETCPKCPFLVEKPCMCGKRSLKNQPCFLADVRCGEVCGRKLRCGSHFCRKQCHRPGECEDAGQPCTQACGKDKKSCGHPCEDSCHAPSVCKEDKPCQHKILITCDCQHLKTETRCLASRSSEGNTQKTLKCDDECARLERNRRLALALNIDPATHQDDHVPYTSQTLQMYQEFPQWAQVQEKELRIFAADVSAKRLRFKPMTPRQRSFLHSLSEDFGFDSESMDPEPYRHVAIFKTPKFVAAPMKTLADCVRIRTVPASTPGTSSQFASDPFNGFLLTSPQFGLTVDELRAALQQAFSTAPTLAFDISFLPDESVVLKAKPSSPTTTISPPSLAASLRSLKAAVSAAVASQAIAGSLSLCTVDTSLNVTRKESDQSSVHNGWSQVAAKAASGMKVAPKQIPIGVKSSYVILGQKAKKKEKQEESKDTIADDWEEEMRREEEAEGLQNADLASA